MRRRSEPHTFEERLAEEKVRLEAVFENIEPGPQRDFLERKLRQIETASRINEWFHRPAGGLQGEPEAASDHHPGIEPRCVLGQGSIIVLELADEDAAIKTARKIAQETGRGVTVRNADMLLIEVIAGR
jgi:hypothetical protein